ncbi:MAG: ubiquitin-activating E1 FCCH domain-containing protein, partial [Planctomycetota bacterium]
MVLLILGTIVMLAGTFVGLMASQRESGTRQTAGQIAAQTAIAGAMYAQQILMSDYQAAFTAQLPQRYPDVYIPNQTERQVMYNYGGPIPVVPAARTGLNWKFFFEGRVGATDGTTDINALGTTSSQWPANQYGPSRVWSASLSYSAGQYVFYSGAYYLCNAANGPTATVPPASTRWNLIAVGAGSPTPWSDPTRPTIVDSMDARTLAVPMQYAPWRNSLNTGWFQNGSDNASWQSQNSYDGFRGLVYNNANAATWPKWFTMAYYDQNFIPLPVTSRASAAYEARISVMALPLDGNMSINFRPDILSKTTGGRFRYGLRNQIVPSGAGEVFASPSAGETAAIASGTVAFLSDAAYFGSGKTAALSYAVGSNATISLSQANAEQTFMVDPVDTDWVGASFPLAQQYATALGNMFGAMGVTDGSSTGRVKKNSSLVYTGPVGQEGNTAFYAWSGATPTYVKTTVVINGVSMSLNKGSAVPGVLTRMMNIAVGQGWLGNFYNYDMASDPGSPWSAPASPMKFQPGPNASWAQYHTKLGFESSSVSTDLTQSLSTQTRAVDLCCFSTTPFGVDLDRTKSPKRNQGDGSLADIDCPWYVNMLLMPREMGVAMVAGMTGDWYSQIDNYITRSRSGSAHLNYSMNQRNLLPIPPRKACPTMGDAFAAVWDDGMAKTGADGIEGGALPPLGAGNTVVLTTTYKRPPANGTEVGTYYFRNDAFAGDAPLVWKNPVRDELVAVDEVRRDITAITRANPCAVTAASHGLVTGDQVNISDVLGMTMVNGGPYTVTVVSTSVFTLNGVDSTAYVAYVTSPPGHAVKVVATPAEVFGYARFPYLQNANGGGIASCQRAMNSSVTAPATTQYTTPLAPFVGQGSGEDMFHVFVFGQFYQNSNSQTHYFRNRPDNGGDSLLSNNNDTVDERLSYQNDITAALWKTLVDCLSDRKYGKLVSGLSTGYDKIEDVETVFLAHLGISIAYTNAASHASTTAMSASDYSVYLGAPSNDHSAPYPLGRMNQLNALSGITTEIGTTRSAGCTSSGGMALNQDGNPGQYGYRNYAVKGVRDPGTKLYTSLGWPTIENPAASGIYVDYKPTWAALSRQLEHRLNDV